MRQPVVRYEYYRPGKGVIVYPHRLVLDRPDVKALLMERYEHADLRIDDRVVLQRHAPSLWFVFPDAWSDVGRFHLADDTFTGWYTNVCTPFQAGGLSWSSTDLFLDLWMPALGEPRWLDEHEFEAAVASRLLSAPLAKRALAERARIEGLLAIGAWPPPMCREMDLAFFRPSLR